jgi:hypothetical protein
VDHLCGFCGQRVSWDEGSYPYVRTLIIVHLSRCEIASKVLSYDGITVEATRMADSLFSFSAPALTAPRTG